MQKGQNITSRPQTHLQQPAKRINSFSVPASFNVPTNHGSPKNNIFLRHFIKYIMCMFQIPTFHIQTEQTGFNINIEVELRFHHKGMNVHTQLEVRSPRTRFQIHGLRDSRLETTKGLKARGGRGSRHHGSWEREIESEMGHTVAGRRCAERQRLRMGSGNLGFGKDNGRVSD
ncbi:hypothetical protein DVH24_000473 [Malus domestica]|uniref:Uncharacterized protein n=1 Tax=Malus domestica TaxID=3750 RepID=A0A498J3I7_MALDO|nr:hypothetical protein DVH24_000473 [Malus domestica]